MISFLKDVLSIVRPYGLRRLALVLAAMIMQAAAQAVGLVSIFPLLNAVSDPNAFRASAFGKTLIHLVGPGSDAKIIVYCGLLSMTMLITSNVISLFGDYIRALYSHKLGHWLRMRLLSHLFSNPYSYFFNVNSTVLTKKLISDVMQFSQQIMMPLLEAATRVLIVVVLLTWLLIEEPIIAVAGAGFMAAYYFGILRSIRRRSSQISDGIKDAGRATYFTIGQALAGIKPIFAADRKNYFLQRCIQPSKELAYLIPRTTLLSGVPRYALETIVFGGLIVWILLMVGAHQNLTRIIPSIGLVAIIAYRVMPSLQIAFGQFVTISSMRQSMEEILDEFRSSGRALGAGEPTAGADPVPMNWTDSVKFEDVTFRYPQASDESLRGISLAIPHGSHVGFVGSTGAGKSTIVDLLLGLLEPTAGQITVDGVVLDDKTRPRWQRTIGYVPQDLFLLDASVAENIAFGCPREEISQDKLIRAASLSQAISFIEDELPEGFDTVVGERGVRLSGGQRQRLAIARALYHEPSLLILDEATSALDNTTERRVLEALTATTTGTPLTIVTVAHRLSTIMDCDCIYFVERGNITAAGHYDALLASHRPFTDLATKANVTGVKPARA